MGLKQLVAEKTKSCAVALPSKRNAQLLDDLSKNVCNQSCNTNATHSIEPLINKDSIRNSQRNHDATVQKIDAQLLPLKMPEKLRYENSELRDDLPTLSGIGGGDNFVISANNTNAQAANDIFTKGEVKPVIPKTVRQVEPLQHTATHSQPYATDELLTRYEKPLFNHLLACPYCHVKKAQYCVSGYAMGSVYDALLLNRDDAQARRESLALRVDRACISGRSVFVPFSRIDAPPPPMQTAPITRKYGNTHEYETFINHWTACKVCKPNLGRYCSEGQRLKVVA